MEEVVEAAEAGCWVLWLGWVGLVIVMWCGIDAWKKEEGGEGRGEERRRERGGGRQRVRERRTSSAIVFVFVVYITSHPLAHPLFAHKTKTETKSSP